MEDPDNVVQTVEIIKRPGQSLGFYIREGNGKERWDGVFISRLAVGSVAEQNGLLKIGDEILSINGNPVIRKRLEDVVISMSIPKRLVLVVRRNPNAGSMAGDATSLGSSLSGGQSGGDEEQPPPVVVVKCPRPQSQSSYNPHTLGSSMVMQASTHSSRSPSSDHYQQHGDFYIGDQQRFAYSSSPAGMQRRGAGDDYWGSLGRMGGPLMIQTQQQGFMGGDDSGDSGLSSDNSGFFRQVESNSQTSSNAAKSEVKQDAINHQSTAPPPNELAYREDYDLSANNAILQNQQFQHQSQQSRPTSFNNSLSSCRAPSIERGATNFSRNPVSYQRRSCSARPDYSSDSDAYNFEHLTNRQKISQIRAAATTTSDVVADFYPSNMQMSGMTLDWPSDYNPQWRFSPGEYATLDRRFSYSTMAPEHQMSIQQRWDVMHSWNQRAKERRETGRYPGQEGEVVEREVTAYPQENQACSSSLNSLLRQFDAFAVDQNRSPYLSDDLTSLYSGGAGGGGVSSDKETYTLGRQMSLNYPYAVVGGGMGTTGGKSPSSAQMDMNRMMTPTGSTSRRRIIKKLAGTDEFIESGKDELADPSSSSSSSYRSLQMHPGSSTRTIVNAQQTPGQQPQGTMSGSSSSLSSNSHQSRTLTRNPSVSGGLGDLPSKNLIKAPLHIRKEAFKPYQSILPHQTSKTDAGNDSLPPLPLEGSLACHVFCGHGLVSNRAVLQDLYCVVELDSLGCARTTVHTGAMNFDWDDKFEMDLYSARFLSFSVYSYDPAQGTRHRLVYGGSVHLSFFLQKQTQHHHRLALQLQPRGVLYIELFYYSVEEVFKRAPSLHLNSLFGTELVTVVEREKSCKGIPLLVIRCVEEIEKRGMGQVGLYRLCGSARRKAQLRDDLEKDPFHIDLSPSVVGDINVVTVILKDFLKELPEPLFPSAASQDLHELYTQTTSSNPRQAFMAILERLHQHNKSTFLFLMEHLANVSKHYSLNKMNIANLSIIFGPLIFKNAATSVGDKRNSFSSNTSLSLHAEILRYALEVLLPITCEEND